MTYTRDAQALRDIIQQQTAKLATIRHKAHLARLALADHDLELLALLLTEIHTGEPQPAKVQRPSRP